MRYALVVLTCLAAFGAMAGEDAVTEARAWRDSALTILKNNTDKDADPAEMARCIWTLERAARRVESVREAEDLATEINSELYWAKKRATLAVSNELAKLRQGAPAVVVAPQRAAEEKFTPKAGMPQEVVQARETEISEESARKAFEKAQRFAEAHATDDFVVALSYFRMSNEYSGTTAGLQAIELARQAQQRFAERRLHPSGDAGSENQSVEAGGAAANSGESGSAVPPEQPPAVQRPPAPPLSPAAQAHLVRGHELFKQAKAARDDLLPKFLPTWLEYASAMDTPIVHSVIANGRALDSGDFYDRAFPAEKAQLIRFRAAKAAYEALLQRAKEALATFDVAAHEFQEVLFQAPDHKHFDAAAFQGLCLAGNPSQRNQARIKLQEFLKQYPPANDVERSLSEYCRAELARVK